MDFLQIILIPFVLFLSGNCGKEGKALQKFEYLENEKSFFDETLLIVLEGKKQKFDKK